MGINLMGIKLVGINLVIIAERARGENNVKQYIRY